MTQQTILLHLSLIPGIGPSAIAALLHAFAHDRLAMLYSLTALEIAQVSRISMKAAQCIVAGLKDTKLLHNELELIEKHAINWVTIADEAYPILLSQIHLPPIVLYYKGLLASQYDKPLAVVGSRESDAYGVASISACISPLISKGYTIISGGALGIDALAHRAAIENDGITVAVLGSGLLRPYPSGNISLFNKIVASGGAVLSSFPLMAEPLPGNFPARNRIIAGLSAGCLVVQAAAKSGALITASFALENGRDVLAVPGPITSKLSAGCNNLIAQGAILVSSDADIRRAFGEIIEDTEAIIDTNKKKNVIKQESVQQMGLPILQTVQEKIMYYMQTALSIDELLLKMEMGTSELQSVLLEMQLDGLIEQNSMGYWKKC